MGIFFDFVIIRAISPPILADISTNPDNCVLLYRIVRVLVCLWEHNDICRSLQILNNKNCHRIALLCFCKTD